MNIISIINKIRTQREAIKYLEKMRWGKKPICPYCGSEKSSKVKTDFRYYHCCKCNRQFSVTVGTIFHDTRLPLKKWLLAMAIIANAKKGISSCQLARDLKINQKTAWRIQMQLRKAMQDKSQQQLMQGIVEVDECYIGGKKKKGDKKKDDDDNNINQRGRGTDKQGVIGAVERETGKVIAKKQDKFSFSSIKNFLSNVIDFKKTTLYTDDFKSYRPFGKLLKHSIINHSTHQYSMRGIHTNTVEGFWGLFKRSIIGAYHKLSVKYLDEYINECCFKYNNRKENIFEILMRNALNLNCVYYGGVEKDDLRLAYVKGLRKGVVVG